MKKCTNEKQEKMCTYDKRLVNKIAIWFTAPRYIHTHTPIHPGEMSLMWKKIVQRKIEVQKKGKENEKQKIKKNTHSSLRIRDILTNTYSTENFNLNFVLSKGECWSKSKSKAKRKRKRMNKTAIGLACAMKHETRSKKLHCSL